MGTLSDCFRGINMASGPDHMRASASSEPLVDREWQATTAVAALTSALDEPHAVAQPAEHVVVRRDSSREEREGMSEASVGTELSAPPAIAVARNSSSSSLSAYELQRQANIERSGDNDEFGCTAQDVAAELFSGPDFQAQHAEDSEWSLSD